MNKKLIIGIFILAVIAIGIGIRMTGNVANEPHSNLDDFAKALTASGAKMYGAFWCGHCQNQKEAFGESWQYINYIECSNEDNSQTDVCKTAGITGYPTWEFGDGTRYSGELTFEELSQRSGVSLN